MKTSSLFTSDAALTSRYHIECDTCSDDGKSALVNTGSSDDLTERLSENLHFDAASYLIIGKRISEALAEII